MSFLANHLLCCPLDQQPLLLRAGSLVCPAGHSFDVGRPGYVNLLSPGEKRSKDPGDSREMVLARADFLNGGHYRPIAEKLSELTMPLLHSDFTLLDAGCGEGYYLEQLRQQFAASPYGQPAVIGFDISKFAVQAAARRFSATWLVASNRNIPLRDNSADILLSLFGFPDYRSFRRVLKPDGHLLLATAGARHLLELREIIYPSIKPPGSGGLATAQAEGFSLVESTITHYTTDPLDRADIGRLLNMTPHMFRATRERKAQAMNLNNFPVTVEVAIHLLRQSGNAQSSERTG